ncbi:outer membrane beta-barrel protein [Rubrolithibacter danxiaensis]|uniref:outer membrane beta-barrel protein n=1 Tax=Rubrolithibacter danxiaensis TaxID=3390805 RepID=UPI003BF80BF0
MDRIEVYNRQSDQDRFSGFNSGETTKTINIVTRADRRNGQFGKVLGGYGNDERYIAGGNINLFNQDQRISVIGLSNNINQQNFSMQDIAGALGSNGGRRGGGRAGGNMRRGGSGGNRMGGGGAASNFLVGQQSGITRTNSIGINYSDSYGKNSSIIGSYFFNNSNNTNDQLLERSYFTSEEQLYNESNYSANNNFNHRFNLRLEHNFDDKNQLVFTPRINLQTNRSENNSNGSTMLQNTLLNQSGNNSNNKVSAYTVSGEALFRHAFEKRGRTFTISLSTDLNSREGKNNLTALNQFYQNDAPATEQINQLTDNNSNTNTITGKISYTEPVSTTGVLRFSYNASTRNGNSERTSYTYDPVTNSYSEYIDSLSNGFNNDYFTNRFSTEYQFRKNKIQFSAGINYQNANLRSTQIFPETARFNRSFDNILPSLQFSYRPGRGKNLQINYRTNVSAPSIQDLQNVIDNTNPLFLDAGNPDLKQQYNHNIIARYNSVNQQNNQNFFVFLNARFTQQYITNATFLAAADTTLNGIFYGRAYSCHSR